jgi:predicted nucleic acid-binding protein
VLSCALDNASRLSIAASALAECLVGPARRSTKAVELACTFFERIAVSVVDLDEETSEHAAVLRARHRSLNLRDALVIGTAEHSQVDHLITTSR